MRVSAFCSSCHCRRLLCVHPSDDGRCRVVVEAAGAAAACSRLLQLSSPSRLAWPVWGWRTALRSFSLSFPLAVAACTLLLRFLHRTLVGSFDGNLTAFDANCSISGLLSDMLESTAAVLAAADLFEGFLFLFVWHFVIGAGLSSLAAAFLAALLATLTSAAEGRARLATLSSIFIFFTPEFLLVGDSS